jgi:two-component system response regulator AtoC
MSRETPRILIVDDDPVTCELLCEVFTREGFAARFTQSGESALAEIRSDQPDILVSDIRMKKRLDGLALLDHSQREWPSLPVILMTAFGSLETAIKAVKEGAFDYISKPFDIETMVATVQRALALRSTGRKNGLDEGGGDEETASGLVGRNPAMLEIYKMIAHVSDSRAAVLITGESGTGKELVRAPFTPTACARARHSWRSIAGR